MDYFERFFGISPDGGSGSLEVACISALLLILLAPLVMPKILGFLTGSRQAVQRS